MSYYEDVYKERINKDGSNRQERILADKAKTFEKLILPNSIYKVEFSYNEIDYIGSLQPSKGSEKDITSKLLLPIGQKFDVGTVLSIADENWLITFIDKVISRGYQRHTVYLLDRTLTWWDKDKNIHSSPVNVLGAMDSNIEDIFNRVSNGPMSREGHHLINVMLPYDETLIQDCYCKLDNSKQRYLTAGYDSVTNPGVMYMTIDTTMVRDDAIQSETPTSYWGV